MIKGIWDEVVGRKKDKEELGELEEIRRKLEEI